MSTDNRDKRLRVSVWVQWEGASFVIDCGPDFRQQMLVNNVERIDGIFFTHEHADHTAGIDDIRPYVFRQEHFLYMLTRVLNEFHKRFEYVFAQENRYPGAPEVVAHQIDNTPFELKGKTIVPISVWHDTLQVFGFRIDCFAYLTDMKTIDDSELEKLKGVKVLVVNALREEPHASHFNLEEALEFINIVKPERAYLTHISHLLGFHAEVEKKLPKNVFLAFDTLTIDI